MNEAHNRIYDLLKADDGQAHKEARRYLEREAPELAAQLAAPALEAPAAVTGRTVPRSDDERAAAQFFADNPGAALLAWPLYLARDKSPALEAPAAPASDLALIVAALEHGQPQMAHYAEPCERHAKTLAAARRMAAAPQAPAAPSAIATQVIENLLQLARIVNTAVEDWGESFEDGSSEVTFHKEEADKLEGILEFFDSLPDAPPEEDVIESGPLRAARVLRSLAAPAAPAVDAKAHDWRENASYGGEICSECGAAKGSRRGNAPCAWPPEPLDVCTDPYNCARCKTHPAHRGDMHHAGISQPRSAAQAKEGGAE